MSATSEGPLAAPRDNLRARVAGGVALIGTAQAVKFATQIVSVMVLSRMLLPEDFGTMAMISPLVAFIGVFQGLGLSSAIANAPTITHSQLSTLFWINATMSAALAALVAACAPLMGLFYHQESVIGPTLAMAATILIWGLATLQTGLMNRQMRFRQYAVIDAVASVLSIAAAIGVGVLWHNVWALVTAVVGRATADGSVPKRFDQALLVAAENVRKDNQRNPERSRVSSVITLQADSPEAQGG